MKITKWTPQLETEALVQKLLKGGLVREIDWEIDNGVYIITAKLFSLVDQHFPGIPDSWFKDAILSFRMEPGLVQTADSSSLLWLWKVTITQFSYSEKLPGANNSGYWRTIWAKLNRKIQKLTKPYCKNCGQLVKKSAIICPNCQSTNFVEGIKLE